MYWSIKFFRSNYCQTKGIVKRRIIFLVTTRLSSLLRQFSSAAFQSKSHFLKKHEVRYQEYTPLGKSILKGDAKITVPYVILKIMDYNILSQTHMMTHIRNYKKCPRECLNWNFRKSVLKDEFLAESPDIFCLQEVEDSHKTELLKPFRKMGYDALYVHRGEGKPDGCAILYKTDQYRAVDFQPVHFMKPEVPLLDRPNVGMVTRLELRNHPGNYIVVANTHLLYNPRRVDIKLCQLQILLAETERLAYNGPNKYHPVILTGDLNVNTRSGLISLLQKRFVDCRQLLKKQRQQPITAVQDDELSLPSKLLQQCLNISNSCQFLDVVKAREKGSKDPRQCKTEDLEKVLQQHRICPDIKTEKSKPVESHFITENSTKESHCKQELKETSDSNKLSSCSLSHAFPFVNVYNHPHLDNKWQLNHRDTERKLNVYDYMFYSCDVRCQTTSAPFLLPKGQLQLLSRLRMPSVSEYHSQFEFLPNYACGSDHLPLTATFLLPVW